MSIIIPYEKKREIISYYKSKPMTINDVALKFNYSNPTIIKILNSFNVKRYTKTKLYSPLFVDNYFETIDTEKKAYFLGLIISDGCIHSTKGKSPMLCLTLKDEDKYIIEELKKELKSNKTVTSDGKGCSNIQFLSTKMITDVKKYGLSTNKSTHEVFPKNIQPDLMKHLIRGLFDGNGNYNFTSRKGRKIHHKAIRLCGGKQLLLDLVEYLYDNLNIDRVSISKDDGENLYSISYHKNNSLIKLIDYMFSDATIYLKRKKRICDLIYNEVLYYKNGDTVVTEI